MMMVFILDEPCNKFGCLLVLNVVAHPELAPIELLWRDVRYDYRQNWEKGLWELSRCWSNWLDNADSPLDGEYASSYYSIAGAYLEYYCRGGKELPTQYQVRKQKECGFQDIPLGVHLMAQDYENLCQNIPNLKEMEFCDLHRVLEPYSHRLNWMRKRQDPDFLSGQES